MAVGAATFLPKPLMAAVGGALFGFLPGLLLSVAGTVAGSALAFAVARSLGREGLRPLLERNRWGRHWERMDAQLTHRPFRTVLVLRAVPFVPFQAITFGAALSGIRQRHFLAGTALGVVPALAVGTAAGAALTRPGPWNLALLAVAAVLVAAVLLLRRLRARPA
ncbi:TVP38/TMEM64 family protein [Streptacidiphilus monticola]